MTGGLFGGGTGFSFGNTAKTTASTGFGFNTATTSASTGFSFGGTSTGSTGFGGTGFGANSTASTGGLFDTSTNTGFSGFGKPAQTSTTNTGFGTGFSFGGASTSAASTGFGSTQTGGLFSNQQQQQQNPVIDQKMSVFINTTLALSAPVVFGDERDAILAKWNQIQAFWGNGKGYYKKDGSFVQFKTTNQYCRFKAVGYSILPTAKDEQGLVAIVLKKKIGDVLKIGKEQISQAVHQIFGSKPNLNIKVDSITELPNDRTEVVIYVEEQSGVTGIAKRVPASELHAFMSQPNILQTIKQKMEAALVVPRAQLPPAKIRTLLENAPSGIDPIIWKQANLDNPDPNTLIPVPMLGFNKLHDRLKHQQLMAGQHKATLESLKTKLAKLQEQQVDTQSTIEAHKRALLQLSHRVLRLIAAQEVVRKVGYAIQPEEEQLRVQLEIIGNEFTAPNQFKGRLNELLSQMRLQHHHHSIGTVAMTPEFSAAVDDESLVEIKQLLKKQQEGLNTLISVIKEDFQDLKIIEKGLASNTENTATARYM